MSSSHPFFHINNVVHFALRCNHLFRLCIGLWLGTTFEIRSEVLQQSHFFLQRVRVLVDIVLLPYILSITRSALDVVEMVTVWVEDNLGCIVEEYSH